MKRESKKRRMGYQKNKQKQLYQKPVLFKYKQLGSISATPAPP